MSQSKLRSFFGISISILCLIAAPLQSHAADKGKTKAAHSAKERLVLMPIRVPEEDKSLTGAMETALVKGLQQKYDVFSGERVAQKAHEIFMKETRNTAHTECDETRCMQNIAEAFQAELIATANVTKQDGSYFLAISIQNIFDNKVEYSESLPCKNCDATQVIEKLKELSGNKVWTAIQSENSTKTLVDVSTNDKESNVNTKLSSSKNKQQTAAHTENNISAQSIAEKKYSRTLLKANSGDAEAQNELAKMYEEGDGVIKDDSKSMKFRLKSAASGNCKAQYRLGMFYISNKKNSTNVAKGIDWLHKSASNGCDISYYILARIYDEGYGGIRIDRIKATDLYTKSFESLRTIVNKGSDTYGYENALKALADMYSSGHGTPKNDLLSAEMDKKLSALGDKDSQYSLGWDYLNGVGLEKDNILAYAWLNLATSQGLETALKLRNETESKLSIAEKQEAQRLSSNWKKGQILVH